ncbi:PTS sugar transporter subunit IIA [Brevundimonas sp.]|uniref:PTS sugar transporter subunit IIA n=1 Tax=Brevundimonas sp. TaxID=1871086 RepID=UPI0025E527DD|nr:PTS sugar transporter subunit IIA [Brevundimonas sp.]
MEIGDLLSRPAVAVRASAPNKRQLLHSLADLAAPQLGVPAERVLEGLLERETLGSTGLGGGVAVPHARLAGLDRVTGVFMKLDQPIAFEAVDDLPVDLFFGLFAPADAGADHLRALASVSRLLRRADIRDRLRQARSADSLYALLVDQVQANAA